MARNIHWIVNFYNLLDEIVQVNIYSDNYTGEPVILIPAADPLSIDEDTTDDIFSPSRTSTGYLRIVDTNHIADSIRPLKTLDRYVEVLNASFQVMWRGFIACGEYSGRWEDSPNLVEFPLVSNLEVLSAMPYPCDAGAQCLGKVIHKAISTTGVTYGAVYMTANSDSKILAAKIRDMAFDRSEDDDQASYRGTNPNLASPAERMSCLQVLEELCKFNGWQIREYGANIYLCATDASESYNHYYYYYMEQLQTGTICGRSQWPDITLPQISSDDNKREVFSPKSQIRIEHAAREIEEKVFDIENFASKADLNQRFYIPKQTVSDVNPEYVYQRLVFYEDDVIEVDVWQFVPDYFIYTDPTQPQHITSQRGCFTLDSYIHDRGDFESLKPVLVLTGGEVENNQPVFVVHSNKVYDFTDSQDLYIDVDFNVKEMSYENERFNGESPKDSKKLSFRLLFHRSDGMTLYYDTDNFSYQWKHWIGGAPKPALIEKGTGTGTLETSMIKGVAIPVPAGRGTFSLMIYATKLPVIEEPIEKYKSIKYRRVTDLTVSIVAPFAIDTDDFLDADSMRYNRQLDDETRDIYSQSCLLMSPSGNPYRDMMRYGVVNPVEDTILPMDNTLDRMAEWYNVYREKLTITVQGSHIPPLSRLAIGDDMYIIGARSINYRDNVTTLDLYYLLSS